MSPLDRFALIAMGATVLIPWALTEITHALGIGVKK